MAVTSDVTEGQARTSYPASELPKIFIIENIIDFAATNRAATNILQALSIGANTLVLQAGIDVLTAEGGTLTLDLGDGTDPDGWLDGINGNSAALNLYKTLHGTGTLDPTSLIDGAGETLEITVTGAALGDFVRVAAPYDLQDLTVSAYVSAADTVQVRIQNESTATVDLASGVWKAEVTSGTALYNRSGGKLYTSADTLDVIVNDAADAGKIRVFAIIFDLTGRD